METKFRENIDRVKKRGEKPIDRPALVKGFRTRMKSFAQAFALYDRYKGRGDIRRTEALKELRGAADVLKADYSFSEVSSYMPDKYLNRPFVNTRNVIVKASERQGLPKVLDVLKLVSITASVAITALGAAVATTAMTTEITPSSIANGLALFLYLSFTGVSPPMAPIAYGVTATLWGASHFLKSKVRKAWNRVNELSSSDNPVEANTRALLNGTDRIIIDSEG